MNKSEIKLKVAAEEIKDVLRKHDLAGAVALHSPGHGEFVLHLNPSYSCAYIYNDNEIRFYNKSTDYATVEEAKEKVMATANMLSLLADITGRNFMMINSMSETFDDLTGAEHSPISGPHI